MPIDHQKRGAPRYLKLQAISCYCKANQMPLWAVFTVRVAVHIADIARYSFGSVSNDDILHVKEIAS